jgi:N utilization substance protein A
VRAEIDSKTGEIRLQRLLEVVETPEDFAPRSRWRTPASATRPRRSGDYISEPLPPLDYGRIAAQSAKQVIMQKVRDAERDRQYEDYKDRIGEIINGPVKRVEYGNVIVDPRPGRGDHPPRRADPARKLPLRGPGPRLCL